MHFNIMQVRNPRIVLRRSISQPSRTPHPLVKQLHIQTLTLKLEMPAAKVKTPECNFFRPHSKDQIFDYDIIGTKQKHTTQKKNIFLIGKLKTRWFNQFESRGCSLERECSTNDRVEEEQSRAKAKRVNFSPFVKIIKY